MKKWIQSWLQKKSNWVFLIILGFFLVMQIQRRVENSKSEGLELELVTYLRLNSNTEVVFPPVSGNAVAIFWASWCAPCKLEMSRLKKSVESGQIPMDRIFAINSFETIEVQQKFLKGEKYPFVFINGPLLGQKLGVSATPSTLFIKNRIVDSLSTGLSLLGIWRAEALF